MQTFTKEQVSEAFNKTPQPVQDLIFDGVVSDLVLEMRSAYKIQVDLLGSISEISRNVLVGLIRPDQLVSELRTLGLPEETVSGIVSELNEKIFKPLRGAQQKSAPVQNTGQSSPQQPRQIVSASTQPVARLAVRPPRPVTPAPTPRPVSAPVVPQQPRPQAPQPEVRPQTPAPARPVISVPPQPKQTPPVFAPFKKPVTSTPPTPIQTQPKPVAPPIQKPPVTPPTSAAPIVSAQEDTAPARPAIRTMMRDADEVQHPAPVVEKPAAPQPVTTPPRMATAPVTTPSFNKTSTTHTPNAQELNDTLKKYGIDPYREPVE